MTTGPYTDIDFVLSGSDGRGDFIGISGSALDKAGIGIFTCNSGSVNFLSKSAGTMLNVYNGPYQYASWQQTRNLYNPVVIKLVKESTLSLSDTVIPSTGVDGNQVRAKNGSVSCYKEPIVSNNAKPLVHAMVVQPNMNEPTMTTSSFTYTYDNNLASFTQALIRNQLGISRTDAGTMYKNMSQLYLDLSQVNLDTNPVQMFWQLDYSQILYPSPINAFLNSTRARTEYAEVAGLGPNGYDRIFGTQRTFFKKDQIRTFGVAENSQGYGPSPAGTGSELVDSLNFNPMATDGIRSYPDSGSYTNRDGELMMDTEVSMFRYKPVPSLAFNELNYVINASGSLTASSGYVERLTEQISGRNPWYNNYEDYAGDLRSTTKDMSILPEFRMSDFMDYYAGQMSNNFRATNTNFLQLPGATITSSAMTMSGALNPTFVSKYVASSDLPRLSATITDHGEVAKIGQIELTCRGVKKLLPYNGFYPANRSVQLGSLLGDSVGPYFTGKEDLSTGTRPAQGRQTLLKPMMSPGIFYNTIKSGIAVDYPIYTGSVPGVVEETTTTPSNFRLTQGPNYRLPFETLINLDGNLPVGNADDDVNALRLVTSFVTASTGDTPLSDLLTYKGYWDGNKTPLYELGMHNFLAETVNFFLEGPAPSEGGALTSFKSSPQPGDGWEMEGGKVYYMDVVLKDTVEMNKFVEYEGVKTLDEVFWTYPRSPENVVSGAFGESLKMVSGSDGLYAVIGAPNFESKNKYGKANLFRRRNDGYGWEQILELPNPDPRLDGWVGDMYGCDVDMVSSSDGFHIMIGAYGWGGKHGRATKFHTTDKAILSTVRLTSSTNAGDEDYGRYVGIAQGSDRYWFTVAAPSASPTGVPGNGGVVFLYNSASVSDASETPFYINGTLGTGSQDFETALTCSDYTNVNKGLRGCNLVVGKMDDGIEYVHVVSGLLPTKTAPAMGSASLWTCSPSNAASYPYGTNLGVTELSLTASDQGVSSENFRFGKYANILSSSNGIYVSVARESGSFTAPPTAATGGAIYVYGYGGNPPFSNPPQESWILENDSGDEYYRKELGTRHDMVSGSGTGADDCIYLTAGVLSYYLDPPRPKPGPWMFKLTGGGAYTSQSLDFPVSPWGSVQSDVQNFGADISTVSSSNLLESLVGADRGNIVQGGVETLAAGFATMFQGNYDSGFETSASYSDRVYKYKQNGKLFGMAIEEEVPNVTYPIGPYDPAYCAYTPPPFYGDAIARISFTPPLTDAYTLQQIIEGSTVENILNVDPSRMAVINDARASLTALQKQVKMPVSSSVNLFGKFFQPTVTYDAATDQATSVDGTVVNPAWVISTRFECPVIDTKNPKYDELYTANNDQITGTYGWQSSLSPQLVSLTEDPGVGITIDPISKTIWWGDQTPSKTIHKINYDGTGKTSMVAAVWGYPRQMALDFNNQIVYWCGWQGSSDTGLAYANMSSGSTVNTVQLWELTSDQATGLALDTANRFVYYTLHNNASTEGIYRRDLDDLEGTATPILLLGAKKGLRTLAFDPIDNKLYYSLNTTTPSSAIEIRRCNAADGSADEVVVPEKAGWSGSPNLILSPALDVPLRKLYYTVYDFLINDTGIFVCDLNGDNEQTLINMNSAVIGQAYYPYSCATDPDTDEMFWINSDAAPDGAIYKAYKSLHTEHNPRTMWTSYGTVPSNDKGIKLELKESFPEVQDTDTTGSLLATCGFTAGSTNVGRVRQTKEISEAIVAIPYLENPLQQEQIGEDGSAEVVNLTTSIMEGINFINIPAWNYNRQKDNLTTSAVAVPGDQNKANPGVEITSTTISNMIQAMKKYVLPPNLDFATNSDISPFVMYIFEFDHTLQQKELTDIWQGVMPDSALKMENDEVVISHDLGPFEFFGNIVNEGICGEMKFFVFKIKQKAKQNYYEITEDAIDDNRFKFKFVGDPASTATSPEGSYNWPYDFFSLVEKAKIEAKFILKNKDEG